MKGFAKINRGLILTVAVLLGVTAYLVAHGIERKQDKAELTALAERYINTEVEYSMLPEKYRTKDISISQDELAVYITEMQTNIKGYYVDNESNYKYLINDMSENLMQQAVHNGIVYSYSKSNFEFKSIVFKGDSAVVTIEDKTTVNKESTLDSLLQSSGGEQTNTVTDTIEFQKVGGEWKVAFSNVSNGIDYDMGNYSELEDLLFSYFL